MYAIVKTGGKQYRVAPEDIIRVEKLPGEAGDTVVLDEVLMVATDGGTEVGAPFVDGASVACEIVEQTRAKKIIIFKKKRRKHYRRKKGHRQHLTVLKVSEILTGGKKPSGKKAAAKKPAAAAKAAPAAKPNAAADAPADDLSLISGVGPVLVKKLNEAGYTTFKQIAEMTPEQIAELDEKLNFKGRIERDQWVEQAKELMAGKPPRAKVDQKAQAKAKKAKKTK